MIAPIGMLGYSGRAPNSNYPNSTLSNRTLIYQP